jgi:hypothetical protein
MNEPSQAPAAPKLSPPGPIHDDDDSAGNLQRSVIDVEAICRSIASCRPNAQGTGALGEGGQRQQQ